MKYTSLTLGLFLGLITKDAVAVRMQNHHHQQHHHKHHQHLAQSKDDAWIDDCQPGRNPFIAGVPNAGTGGSYPGVGVECQGFAQKGSRARDDAWIDDCAPSRNPFVAGNPNGAGTFEEGQKGSYPGVGVECQGFSQKKSQRLAQDDAWIDDCAPSRNPFVAGNPDGAGTWTDSSKGSYPGVGVECQGFAQKKSHSLAQQKDDAWIDDCQPGRNPFVAGNPDGAGTYNKETGGSYPGVGVECQGFAQQRDDAWIDDCQPGRNPFIAGVPNAGTGGSYPGVGVECQGFHQKNVKSLAQMQDDAWIDDCSPDRVMNGAYGSGTQGAPGATAAGSFDKVGVECQGFAQRKSKSLAQLNDDAWIDDCQPGRNPFIAGVPNAGTGGSYPGVGVECQGFAQKKSHSLAQDDAWIPDCNPNRNPFVAGHPDGAGTGGSYPGVGITCQGFAQKKSHSLAQDDAWIDDCQPGRNPFIAGVPNAGTGGSYPGVGVECQGFAQKKSHNLAQQKDDAWIDDCQPGRNPFIAGVPNAGTGGSYPGVGVECQGFAQTSNSQKKQIRKHHYHHRTSGSCPDDLPDCNGTNGVPGTDCCDE